MYGQIFDFDHTHHSDVRVADTERSEVAARRTG
jgi:hypothetical protein